ncbi:hypothetical protein B7P43_G05898 [Cryptotermes secundus]|uniref:Uncharacterized protein n=1 Tax=Cryptotermes secundus TaxID=105785 RepID=A0A2J7RIL4_9NEOP|nr:hypothetical protein B7P43_G05898 [Cryptotermes secundus]
MLQDVPIYVGSGRMPVACSTSFTSFTFCQIFSYANNRALHLHVLVYGMFHKNIQDL